MTGRTSRRQLLGRIGTLAAVGALAGCSSDGGGGDGGDGGSNQPDWPSYLDDATEDSYEDLRGESEVTVGVYSNYFDPTKIRVDAGTTVTWEFESMGHNVKPNSQPDGGGLDGTEGGKFATRDQGETYSATLETTGTYTYFCGPHESVGMKGGIEVE